MLDFLFLIATFNRREKTLAFINQVSGQCRALGKSFLVVVVDNNSTDGTAEAINLLEADTLLISTPKDMYWAESMSLGYCEIVARKIAYKHLCPANDDISLREDAVGLMLRACETLSVKAQSCVLVAPFSDSSGNNFTYGGQKSISTFVRSALRPLGRVSENTRCDSFNMNFIMLPKEILDRYGFIDNRFIHGLGDFDYGLRLSKQGIAIYQMPGFLGSCNRNSFQNSPFDSSLPLVKRISMLFSKKFFPFCQVLSYTFRHSGILCFVHIAYIYLSPFFIHLKRLNPRG